MADIKAAQRVRIYDGPNDTEVAVAVRDSAAGATDGGISLMAVRKDSATALAGTDNDYSPLQVDSTGNLRVTVTGGGNASVIVDDSAFTPATSSVTAAGYFADETAPDSVDEGDIGAARMTLDRKQLMVLVDPTTDSQRLAIDADGQLVVKINQTGSNNNVQNAETLVDDAAFTVATSKVFPMGALFDDVTPDTVDEGDIGAPRMTSDRKLLTRIVGSADANRLEVSAAGAGHFNLAQVLGATHSETNPVYVKVVDTVVSASEVHSYNTAAAVASDATSNHDYTVVNTTFLLKRVLVAASGAAKWEIQTGPLAGLATVAVAFTSAAKPTEQVVFDPPHEVPVTSTGTVRVIRRNDDNQAMDVYSTIMGNDV